MSREINRPKIDREAEAIPRRRREDCHEVSGEADAVADAFLSGNTSDAARLGSALSRADGASRARLVSRLQRTRGNTFVQRVIAALHTQGPQATAPSPAIPAPRAGPGLLAVQRNGRPTGRASARALFETGVRQHAAGAYRGAIRSFERARQLPGLSDELNAVLLYNLGMCNLRLNRFNTAISYFERYLQTPGLSDTDRPEAQARLAEARRGAGIPVDLGAPPAGGGAPGQAGGASPSAEQEGRALFQRASQQFAAADYRGAIVTFEEVQRAAGPGAGTALLYNIGLCNLRLRRFHAAINNFEDYLASPATVPGDRADGQARLDEARRAAGLPTGPAAGEGAAESGPSASPVDRARTLLERGVRQHTAGDYLNAIRSFERARSLPGLTDEARSALVYNIGMSTLRLNRFNTAIHYFELYLGTPGLSDADRTEAQARLNEARRRAGIPVEEESAASGGAR